MDCRFKRPMPSFRPVRWAIGTMLLGLSTAAAAAQSGAPLYDSVRLNIGLNCQWQQKCIARQQKAMKRALAYVRDQKAPIWRVHQCNRNASRTRFRVDWVGFDNCIRNASLPRRASQLRVSKPTITGS